MGPQGPLTRVGAERGSRPLALRDQRPASASLVGAIGPARGTGAARGLPDAHADRMTRPLAEMGAAVAPGAQAGLGIDGAGWPQRGRRRQGPQTLTRLPLPPSSPERNPVEHVWAYRRRNKPSHRVVETYDAVVDAWLATLGPGSSLSPTASPPSAHDLGLRSINDAGRIRLR
jgi:hypothetical protein